MNTTVVVEQLQIDEGSSVRLKQPDVPLGQCQFCINTLITHISYSNSTYLDEASSCRHAPG